DLKTKLDKIEEKLKGIVSYEKSHKVVEELNVLMIKQILPFHREIHGVKKISILPLVKKAAFNEVPEKMQRAFWPKKMKIKRVKDENVNLFSKKQEQIDRQIANEDFKIQVAHRMHLLVLGGIAQFTLLILTGVFFFWYPNTWMMVALTCSDYAIAVSRLGIEFWFSYHNRKRILQMQRYLAQHPDGVPIPGNRLDINRLYKVQQKYGLIDVSATDARMRVEGSIVFKKQPIGKIKIKLNCAEQKEMEFFSKLEENRRLKVLYEKNKSELEADEENREAKLLNNSKKYKLILLEMIIHQCDVSSDHVLFNKAKRAIQESSFCEPKVLESVDQEISDFTEIEAMIRVNKQGKTIELFKEIEIKVPAIKELKDALGLIADNGRMCGDKQLLEFRILELENEEKNRIIPGNYLAKIHHRRKLDIESHRINTILPMEADVLKKEAEKLRACLYSQKIPRF
ncbi:MAG: hypothetical protein KDK55_03750, partial [Chlamydiia bacterium]|nr:hypothetical protein [Chlamydiia bacterium]